jgi:LacI family sucrose operon transcriptional repressor
MQMMLACTNNNEAEEVKYIQTFSENHVDGIILIGTIFTPQHHALFKKLKTPLVILSQKIDGFSCIYSDDYHAAYSMGKKLVKTAKKVGLIMVSERDIAVGQNRKSGLIDSFEEAGIRISEDYIRTAGFTMESGYEETGKLIEAHPDIDTIVCATDTIASGAIKKLHDLGIRIPEDVQIAGFGDSQVSSALTPSLTTIHFYYEEAGHEAAQILMKRVEGADTSVVKEMQLAYDTIVRESTR